MSTQSRNGRQDFLRAAAIFSVVLIHSVFGFESTPAERTAAEWLSTFARPCIAVFLFVSGFFFPSLPTTGQMLARFQRILVPYLVFSLLALLYQTRVVGLPAAFMERPWVILENLLTGNTWGVYWFIPVIVLTYLGGWVLARPASHSLLWVTAFFLAVNLFLVAYFEPIVDQTALSHEPMVWFFCYRVLPTWPVYFFLGQAARVYDLTRHFLTHRRYVLGMWVAVFLAYNVLFWLGVPGATGGYRSIIDTLYAIASIAALTVIARESPWLGFVGRTSYTTYLMHYFIVSLTQWIATTVLSDPPFWLSFVVFGLSLGGSLVFAWAAQHLLGERARQWFGV